MAKKPPNQGKPWTSQNVKELDMLAKQNTPTRLIAFTMGRTLEAVYRKAKRHFAETDRSIALSHKEVRARNKVGAWGQRNMPFCIWSTSALVMAVFLAI